MADLLLVDLDNTLIDRAAGFERWATAFLRGLGRHSPPELAWLHLADQDGMASRTEFFGRVRGRYGLAESVEGLAADYRAGLPGLIPPPTHATLAALRTARESGFKISIVTNGSRDTQEPKIAPTLADVVDCWAISGEVGVRKPDPAILRAAAALCGEALTPDSWMIGDRPESDVLCAWRAGIRSAWLTRGQVWDHRLRYRPTLEVPSIVEAIEQILAVRSD